MFQAGELVVYGVNGVCRVKEIAMREIPDAKMCYILEQVSQSCTITIPVDHVKVNMRPVISREEAEALIDSIPARRGCVIQEKDTRQLSEHYNAIIKSCNCDGLVDLTMSIYAKKQQVLQQKRKFGTVDERFLKLAESLLFGEMAVALDMPAEEVQGYIEARVGKLDTAEELV